MNFIVAVRAESLIAKMEGAPAAVRRSLKAAMDRLSILVQRSVKEDRLSGQILHVRTGTLRRSINREVTERADGVFAVVGTNVRYGAMWEGGFTRTVGAGARGGPRTLQGRALDRYFQRHPPETRDVAARPFLRPTLEEFKPRIRDDVRAAVMEAMR